MELGSGILLTHLCRVDSSTILWTGPFPTELVSGYFVVCFIEISVINTNSIYPDQTPR